MDRPSGPLGAATQSRGMPDNTVPTRRPVGTPPNALPPASLAGSVPPVPPIPDLRTVPSNSALAAAGPPPTPTGPVAPASPARVISLFTEAIQNALRENEAQAQRGNGGTAGSELKPGVTIDLSREGIRELPEEVVDVIKNELERCELSCLVLSPIAVFGVMLIFQTCRLALSHNQLSTFPARFAECTSLRYLNVRNNRIEEFPLAV